MVEIAFHRGAGVGIVGSLVAMGAFVLEVLLARWASRPPTALAVAFDAVIVVGVVVMLAGPLWFWVGFPIYHHLR